MMSGILSDHVEHRVEKRLVANMWDHEYRARPAQMYARGHVKRLDLTQRGAEAILNADGRVRIVDSRRQRANGNLDQLAYSKAQVR